jgi:hypothetical protein
MRKLILILLTILGASCNRINNEGFNSLHHFDLSDQSKYLVDTNIIDKYKYIRLESNNESLIGEITKIRTYNDKIIILDKRFAKAVFIFDTTGKFIDKINKQGKGPGEFVSIFDFDIDETGALYIFDLSKNEISCFNIEDLSFVKSIALKTSISSFVCSDKSFVLYRGNRPGKKEMDYNILTTDAKLQVNNKFFKFRKDLDDDVAFSVRDFLIKSESILYSPLIDNKVYSVGHGKLIPKYEFQFGKYELNDYAPFLNEFKMYHSIDFVLQNKDFAYAIQRYYENEDFFICVYKIGRKVYRFIYSKQTGKYIIKKIKPYEQTKDGFIIWGNYVPFGIKDNYIIGIIDQNEFSIINRLYNDKPDFMEDYPKNYRLKQSYNEMMNPILLLYSIKKF